MSESQPSSKRPRLGDDPSASTGGNEPAFAPALNSHLASVVASSGVLTQSELGRLLFLTSPSLRPVADECWVHLCHARFGEVTVKAMVEDGIVRDGGYEELFRSLTPGAESFPPLLKYKPTDYTILVQISELKGANIPMCDQLHRAILVPGDKVGDLFREGEFGLHDIDPPIPYEEEGKPRHEWQITVDVFRKADGRRCRLIHTISNEWLPFLNSDGIIQAPSKPLSLSPTGERMLGLLKFKMGQWHDAPKDITCFSNLYCTFNNGTRNLTRFMFRVLVNFEDTFYRFQEIRRKQHVREHGIAFAHFLEDMDWR